MTHTMTEAVLLARAGLLHSCRRAVCFGMQVIAHEGLQHSSDSVAALGDVSRRSADAPVVGPADMRSLGAIFRILDMSFIALAAVRLAEVFH